MINRSIFSLAAILLLLCAATPMFSQDPAAAPAVAPAPPVKAWKYGASLGSDFAQLLQINPRPGSGQNRLGFGGAINIFASYKNNRLAWDNKGSWQIGLQRFGSGPIAGGKKIPFQKSNDVVMFASAVGYKVTETSKFSYAVDFNFISQITPTFQGPNDYPGLFLTRVQNASLLSRFFSPAIINLSLGIGYKPNDKFSFFYSPLGAKWVVVNNNTIAALGVHGNPVTKDAGGVITSFQNVDAQLGSVIRATYANKFWKDRITLTSNLLLFSNYLQNPQNIDVNFNNELGMTIIKGLQLSLLTNFFYDDNMRMQITDYNFPNGVKPGGGGPRLSITEQLLLKYAVTF